jgi:hypothetical protein
MTDELHRGFKLRRRTFGSVTQTGYEKGGLAVVNNSDRPGWFIYPAKLITPVVIPSSPMELNKALDIAEALLSMPINWKLSRAELEREMQPYLISIRVLFSS